MVGFCWAVTGKATLPICVTFSFGHLSKQLHFSLNYLIRVDILNISNCSTARLNWKELKKYINTSPGSWNIWEPVQNCAKRRPSWVTAWKVENCLDWEIFKFRFGTFLIYTPNVSCYLSCLIISGDQLNFNFDLIIQNGFQFKFYLCRYVTIRLCYTKLQDDVFFCCCWKCFGW